MHRPPASSGSISRARRASVVPSMPPGRLISVNNTSTGAASRWRSASAAFATVCTAKPCSDKRFRHPLADEKFILDEQEHGSVGSQWLSFSWRRAPIVWPWWRNALQRNCVQAGENFTEIVVYNCLRRSWRRHARPLLAATSCALEEAACCRLNEAHGKPRVRTRRHHAGSAAEGVCLRHFSDGGKRRRPGALLDRAGAARHHSARPVPRAEPARPHGAFQPFHRRGRPRF